MIKMLRQNQPLRQLILWQGHRGGVSVSSVDDVETGVLAETLGNDDTFGSLIVLKEGCHDTGECKGRAVESVTELRLLVLTAVAAFETVGLIGLEVRYRGYLEPATLSSRVHLEVECDGGGEAHVTAAKTEDVPGQAELFEQTLYVSLHFFEGSVAVLGFLDAHDFHLIELVETVEAAHVLAVAAGFATEACRVGAVLDGELVAGDDDVTVEVGDRYFGGGDEVEAVEVDEVHLAFLVGELTCTVAGGFVHHIGGLYFKVAGSGGFVEEELDECALELGTFAEIYGETGAGYLDTEFEVNEIVLGGQIPVGESILGQLGHGTAGGFYDVVGSRGTGGHGGTGYVGDVEEFSLDFSHGASELFGDSFLLLFEYGYVFFSFFSIVAATFLHGFADGGSQFVEFGGGVIVLKLELTTEVVECEYTRYGFLTIKALDGKTLYNQLGVCFNLL